MNITDIEVGQTYACKFKIRTLLTRMAKQLTLDNCNQVSQLVAASQASTKALALL
jgi:hypothetical protein